MRLNRIESFYASLLCFRSEGNEEEGQPSMARPPARGRSATAKSPLHGGDRLRPGLLQGAATRKGSSPQGAATHNGSSPQGAVTRRGNSCPRARPTMEAVLPARRGATPTKALLTSTVPTACTGATTVAAQKGQRTG
ncbi:hypothetical protein B296_00037921 [Ensete ventricosum]|uniref:Uncharacterized protein n=1 Tax=Ensete ventricosum TaxID=4639 RepID=A0A426YMM8_ENSVE|nr:hypothetical protein B296_00037921 [Ensete ventricosum]